MKPSWPLIFIIAVVSGLLYRYIDMQNQVLTLRRTLPALTEQVRYLQRENMRLEYEVAISLAPQRLWQLARQPEYGHLHFVLNDATIVSPLESHAVFN